MTCSGRCASGDRSCRPPTIRSPFRGARTPGAIALAAESGRFDAYVALGVVIRGETYHFEIVAGESARGLLALTMDGIAVGNGILTVENEAQAIARANPKHANKGGGAAEAALAPQTGRRMSVDQRSASRLAIVQALYKWKSPAKGSTRFSPSSVSLDWARIEGAQ
jgi:hypothetical protein